MKRFIGSLVILAGILGGVAHAIAADSVVMNDVGVNGNGGQPQNIATDQTKLFENRYGSHDPRDQVLADLTLYAVDGIFIFVVLLSLLESKRKVISAPGND